MQLTFQNILMLVISNTQVWNSQMVHTNLFKLSICCINYNSIISASLCNTKYPSCMTKTLSNPKNVTSNNNVEKTYHHTITWKSNNYTWCTPPWWLNLLLSCWIQPLDSLSLICKFGNVHCFHHHHLCPCVAMLALLDAKRPSQTL
jgi:hypothetical protein